MIYEKIYDKTNDKYEKEKFKVKIFKNEKCFLSKREPNTLLSFLQNKNAGPSIYFPFPSLRVLQNMTTKHKENKNTFFPMRGMFS